MPKKIKHVRLPGFKTKFVYRDTHGRFSTREKSVGEEAWKYRVDKKGRVYDLKIDALPFREAGKAYRFRSLKIPETGKNAGLIGKKLSKTLSEIGFKRHDTKIEISMKAKTYRGKIISRKISLYHYDMKKLQSHTIGAIMEELFYEYGDRPAYPVEIVKGWRSRKTMKKETEKRRQLYDVTFSISASPESRKKRRTRGLYSANDE